MTTNLDLVSRFIRDFLGRGDPATADAVLDEHVVGITGLKPDGPIPGREAYKAIIAPFVEAFPAVAPLQILDQFASADGQRAVTRFHSHQRHARTFFGVPPTDRVVLFDETHVTRVIDGRIVENIVSATNPEFEMPMAPVLAPMILAPR